MADKLQFVSFYSEGRMYGLDIRIVKEINPNVNITPVPRSDNYIRGLVNIRGQVILVLDIAMMFGRGQRPFTEDSHIVIMKTAPEIRKVRNMETDFIINAFGDKPVAFLVDKIGDVISVYEDQVEPAPPHLDELKAKYVFGVVRMEDQLLMIINAAQMLS